MAPTMSDAGVEAALGDRQPASARRARSASVAVMLLAEHHEEILRGARALDTAAAAAVDADRSVARDKDVEAARSTMLDHEERRAEPQRRRRCRRSRRRRSGARVVISAEDRDGRSGTATRAARRRPRRALTRQAQHDAILDQHRASAHRPQREIVGSAARGGDASVAVRRVAPCPPGARRATPGSRGPSRAWSRSVD